MKKIISFITLLIGFLYYIMTYVPFNYSGEYNFNPDEMKSVDTGISFLDIFLNNFFLCLILSFIGYFTGGLLTLILLFWNGYIIAMIYNLAFRVIALNEIVFLSKHLPFEILAIILFSEFGLNGFHFYKKIIIDKKIIIFSFFTIWILLVTQ